MREIILDTETTGLDPKTGHRIIELGCIEIFNKQKTGNHFHFHINPERDVPIEAYRIHGISTEFLRDKPLFKDIAQGFIEFIADSRIIIHNAPFDLKFLNAELLRLNHQLITIDRVFDTLVFAKKKFPGAPASLDALCKRFKVDNAHRQYHGALLDSELLFEVYVALTEGDQSEFNLKKDIPLIAKEQAMMQQSVPYRKFELREEEQLSHQEFLKKIKNPLWDKEG